MYIYLCTYYMYIDYIYSIYIYTYALYTYATHTYLHICTYVYNVMYYCNFGFCISEPRLPLEGPQGLQETAAAARGQDAHRKAVLCTHESGPKDDASRPIVPVTHLVTNTYKAT